MQDYVFNNIGGKYSINSLHLLDSLFVCQQKCVTHLARTAERALNRKKIIKLLLLGCLELLAVQNDVGLRSFP